jgi:hypothetical protein
MSQFDPKRISLALLISAAFQATDLLLDHLVGGDKEVLRNGEAESLGGPKIDDQLELGGPHYGQVGEAARP